MSSVSVQEVIIYNHKNRILLVEGRQKDYEFLLNECKQLCEDKHYATDEVNTTVTPLYAYSCTIGTTYLCTSKGYSYVAYAPADHVLI